MGLLTRRRNEAKYHWKILKRFEILDCQKTALRAYLFLQYIVMHICHVGHQYAKFVYWYIYLKNVQVIFLNVLFVIYSH